MSGPSAGHPATPMLTVTRPSALGTRHSALGEQRFGLDGAPDLLNPLERLGGVGLPQDHDELLAAIARHQVVWPPRRSAATIRTMTKYWMTATPPANSATRRSYRRQAPAIARK